MDLHYASFISFFRSFSILQLQASAPIHCLTHLKSNTKPTQKLSLSLSTMGNTKLIRSLRAFQRAANISEYQGKTVAIDGPSILYHGGFAAARDVALSQSSDL